jgi:hypothetical protein
MMNKPAAFIMIEGGRTWFRTSAETEEAIRTGFIMETVPLYTAPPKQERLSEDKLDVLAEANITDEGIAGYYLGFRDAEKYHGIGGGDE